MKEGKNVRRFRINRDAVRAISFAGIASLLPAITGCNSPARGPAPAEPRAVHPVAETDPTESINDAADDPAIWVHPTDPSRSLVLGSDKDAGVGVYTLSGDRIAFHTVGSINNIDTAIVNPTGKPTHIVAGTAVDENAVFVWAIDPASRTLTRIDNGGIPSTLPDVYGFALTTLNNRTLALTTSKAGLLEVTEIDLQDSGKAGAVRGTHIATIPVGGQLEGVVADPASHAIYVGEEAVGVWRYDLPSNADGSIQWDEARHARKLVDSCRDTQGVGNLISDAEGLALWAPEGSASAGYLIVSSQGDDRYCVYDRAAPNAYLGSFQIKPGGSIDGTTHTDGIGATAAPLGTSFPHGLFVAQDDDNSPSRQNFKAVDWRAIANALGIDPD